MVAKKMKSPRLSKSPVKFFKVVLPSDIEDQKLSIPVKSAREFGDELSDVATLTVPNGDVWLVGLERSHNEIWFVHNWHRFITHYSITHGMFLVFGYQGNSTFHVCIYDFSCCEIEYPPTIVEDVNNNDARRTTRRASSSVKGKGKCVEHFMRKTDAIPTRSKIDCKAIFLRKISVYTSPKRKSHEEYEKVIHATTMFKLEGPFFAVILTRLNFKTYHMLVPGAFAQKYMSECSSSIRIEDSNGQWWNLGYYKQYRVFRLGRGCHGFFKDNDLKEDDVCLFELKKKRDGFVLKVSVLHNAEYAALVHWKKKRTALTDETLKENNRSTQEIEANGEEHANNNAEADVRIKTLYFSRKVEELVLSRETKRALRNAEALSVENPAFVVILRACNMLNSYVLVPADFARVHMLEGDYYVKLVVENENEASSSSSSSSSRKKQWSVLCDDLKPSCRTKQMKNGWREFSEENDLEEGDVCVLEMINKTKFKVSIFRATTQNEEALYSKASYLPSFQ